MTVKDPSTLALYGLTLLARYPQRFASESSVTLTLSLYLDDHEGNGQGTTLYAKLGDLADEARTENLDDYQMEGTLRVAASIEVAAKTKRVMKAKLATKSKPRTSSKAATKSKRAVGKPRKR